MVKKKGRRKEGGWEGGRERGRTGRRKGGREESKFYGRKELQTAVSCTRKNHTVT